MSRIAARAAVALALAGLTDEVVVRPVAGQFPLEVRSAASEPPLQTVRPAAVPRNLAEAGYFHPLYQPSKTEAALEQVVAFDVEDMPMERFFAGLEETTGVPFYLDETGLEEAAITSDAEITCRSAGMPLHVALDLLMRDLDLAYVPKDEYVLVTSRESAEQELQTRLYALADHPLMRGADAEHLASAIVVHVTHDRGGGFGDIKACILSGCLAIAGNGETLPRAEEFLRQYARMLAEYDAAPAALSDSIASAEPSSSIVAVRRAPVARDASRYFRRADRPSKAELALEKPADLDVDDMSLDRFFIDRERVLGIPFRLDAQQMQSSYIEPDDQVSFRAKGMSHAAALELMLRNLDLKFVPLGDYVLVTSIDDERYQVAKRSYQIAGHPLLTSDGGDAFLKSLRRHIAWEGMEYPKTYGIAVRQGTLTISADDRMLEQADAFLKQYARLLAEYDAVERSTSHSTPPGSLATVRGANPGDFFRPLRYRARTHLALERRAEIDLEDVPLEKFFAELERTLGVPFVLDETGLEEAAITSDVEVTFHATGASYADALSQMLDGLGLAFIATDDYVSITSREAAEFEYETRMYAVLDNPRLQGEELKTFVATIGDRLGVDDPRNGDLLLDLLPGTLVVTGYRDAIATAEESLRADGLASAEYAPEKLAPPKPPLTFRLPPRLVRPALSPDRETYPIRPGADPFDKPAPEPFAKPPADPFAPTAGSGR